MANSHKGEVAFEAGGKKRTLRFDTNAICILEEDLGLSIAEIAAQLKSGRVSAIRAALRAGLNGGGDLTATLRKAGELIDELGYERAVALVSDAFALAFPKAAKEAGPPKGAGAGTGKRSS